MRNEQFAEYGALAKKIIKKKRWIIAISVFLVLLVLVLCTPGEIIILDKTHIQTKGTSPVITGLLILLILFFEAIAIAFAKMPLTSSMEAECDPQKFLYLNTAVNNTSKRFDIYACALFYMGDFNGVLGYADKMIASGKKSFVLVGLFNKARSEFFLNDFKALRQTVRQYENIANNYKLKERDRLVSEIFGSIFNLLLSIADEDKEKIAQYAACVKPWNKSKATEGFINYLKGVAAYYANNKTDAIYHLMAVKANCSKTVLATLAHTYLEKLNKL